MNFCSKHLDYAGKLAPHANLNEVLRSYIDKYVNIDGNDQEIIERSKTKCPVCFHGHTGKAYLKEMLKPST